MNAKETVMEILREHGIKSGKDLFTRDGEEVAELYDCLSPIQEEFDLSEDDMEELMEEILGGN